MPFHKFTLVSRGRSSTLPLRGLSVGAMGGSATERPVRSAECGMGKGKSGNIEHRTSNIEHRTSNAERRTPNSSTPKTPDPRPQTQDPRPKTPDPRPLLPSPVSALRTPHSALLSPFPLLTSLLSLHCACNRKNAAGNALVTTMQMFGVPLVTVAQVGDSRLVVICST